MKVVLESWDVTVDQILEKTWEQLYKSEGDLSSSGPIHSKYFIKTGCIAQNVRISEFEIYVPSNKI